MANKPHCFVIESPAVGSTMVFLTAGSVSLRFFLKVDLHILLANPLVQGISFFLQASERVLVIFVSTKHFRRLFPKLRFPISELIRMHVKFAC